jgi:hypothetical protein
MLILAGAAASAAHALIPPPALPDDLQRYIDPRLANVSVDLQRQSLI